MVLGFLLWLFGLFPDSWLRAGSRLLFSRSWARFEAATEDPRGTQVKRLLAIVDRAKDTAFGKEHRFSEIRSLEDYRRLVPIRDYTALEPYIERMVRGERNVLTPDEPLLFARSSGTTGRPKYIPVTPMYLAEFRVPRRVWARQVMQAFPGLIRGRVLGVQSPKIEGHTEGGVPYGSITVAYASSSAAVARHARSRSPFDVAPRSIFLIDDARDRYYALLRLAAQERVTLAAAVNPSTLVLLAKKLDERADDLARDLDAGTMAGLDRLPEPIQTEVRTSLRRDPRSAERIRRAKGERGRVIPTDLWPEIAGLLTWTGGSAPFYLAQLGGYYPGKEAMDYGFVATEGGFTIPLAPKEAGGVIAVTGHVIELIPERAMSEGKEEPALLADALTVGERYRVVITGSHGLYRYDINDVVECVGYHRKTAKIAFVHKGGNMISVTGEKIGESHVVEAAAKAEHDTRLPIAGFCVTLELSDPPRYVLGIEPERAMSKSELVSWRDAFESALCAVNIEYAAKRSSERLARCKLRVLPKGAFERERDRRIHSGAPESHVKPLHLAKDRAAFDALGVEMEIEVDANRLAPAGEQSEGKRSE
jgi:hypothetical protein